MLNNMCIDCLEKICGSCKGTENQVWTGCVSKKAAKKGQIWERNDGASTIKITNVAARANNPEIFDITFVCLEDEIVSHMRVEWLLEHYHKILD
ncbi:MAG: hypothetical protein LUG61_04920 [Lachnospiraceae bacterium]|nr:hypothetical protein [Lachnospiraceae bacterium]